MARIGLLAGHGSIPVIFARSAKQMGDTVIAFAIKGMASDELLQVADKVHWLEWGQLQKGIMLLVTERIRKIVLLGKVKKELFFKGDQDFDASVQGVLERSGDRKDYAIYKKAAGMFKAFGIEIIDPTPYLSAYIPAPAVISKRQPTPMELLDIAFGADVSRELAKHDIGQTVVVKDKAVIALEAVEGTDEVIRRAGRLCKAGFTVVKSARPQQDMRFDIPLVGLETVKTVAEAGGKALAMESGKTLLIDREAIVQYAAEKDLAIVVF